MHDGVETVSGKGIQSLAELFRLDIAAGESETLAAAVNERLTADLDSVYDIPIEEQSDDADERTWSPPTDPYNAISVSCHVPPTADHTGELEGITIGIKDIIAVAGVPMQCASEVMQGFTPNGDATVTSRLREAGGSITAKTNLDEFAGGGRGRSRRGLIRNPHDEGRIAGGSSGGSGAAVAANLVDAALGTDTGGSLRKPAAFCDLVGLKPTYGLVPLTGVVENTYTLDHVGPITRGVEDAARILKAIAGKDPRDPATMAAAGKDAYRVGNYIEAVRDPPDVGDLRIGVASQGLTDDMDETVASRHAQAIDLLDARGASVEEVEIPFLDQVKHVKNIISYVELATYWRDGGAPVRRGGVLNTADQTEFARRARAANDELNDFYRARMFAGAQLLAAHNGRHYTRAHAAREVIRSRMNATLEGFDVIATPTVPHLAPKVERVRDPAFDYDGLGRDVGYGRYTKVANVTGLPAVTIPNAVDDGPAVGLQLVGHPFDEVGLLRVAKGIEGLLRSDRS